MAPACAAAQHYRKAPERQREKHHWRDADRRSHGRHGYDERHEEGYMVAGLNVYYRGRKVNGAYASTFKELGYGYGKDSFNAYYRGEKVQQAYASSFETLVDGYARDNFNAYYRGVRIDFSMEARSLCSGTATPATTSTPITTARR